MVLDGQRHPRHRDATSRRPHPPGFLEWPPGFRGRFAEGQTAQYSARQNAMKLVVGWAVIQNSLRKMVIVEYPIAGVPGQFLSFFSPDNGRRVQERRGLGVVGGRSCDVSSSAGSRVWAARS